MRIKPTQKPRYQRQ
uniref:Uncharacterized protein n=1 Tax=Rhizophora mucronata TaxID=61149 RepID=A0A2P2MWQ6_RHIMU